MNTKTILIFVSGLAVGGAAGILGTKKYFQDKYFKRYGKENYEDLEEYYKRVDEYTRKNHEEYENDGLNPVETDSKPGGRMSQEERKEIKEKLNRNWKETINYAGMYRGSGSYTEEKLAEGEHPLDQGEPGESGPEDLKICANCKSYDPDTEICEWCNETMSADDSCEGFESLNIISPEEQAFDEHQKNKNKQPKIISAEAYSNLPASIDQEVLYFYASDETLCDDNEEPVEEPERLIGDALTKYGFIDNDERIIFVMNYSLDTCYEIQKVDASWSDSH